MANYPERPVFPRRKKPRKGSGRPSSEKASGGKKKVWLSDRSVMSGGRDISPRLTFPWYMSPMYKEQRVKRWNAN